MSIIQKNQIYSTTFHETRPLHLYLFEKPLHQSVKISLCLFFNRFHVQHNEKIINNEMICEVRKCISVSFRYYQIKGFCLSNSVNKGRYFHHDMNSDVYIW